MNPEEANILSIAWIGCGQRHLSCDSDPLSFNRHLQLYEPISNSTLHTPGFAACSKASLA